MAQEMGDSLVRIRLGSMSQDGEALTRARQPFTAVPYRVKASDTGFVESSARSRGFKFALISGIAAFLAKAHEVIVPESGQGALGPALVTVGQAHEDYRSHPLFTERMEKLIELVLGHRLSFRFPQLWNTKGETLRRYVMSYRDTSWSQTWSCWRQNRHVSVDGKRRQCGVCAACMLRRMSIHAAGVSEPSEHYVWTDLSAPTFEAGAVASYRDNGKITNASREYAIAGALHLDHLAGLVGVPTHSSSLDLAAFQLGAVLGLAQSDTRARLDRLLKQHKLEWENFMLSLGRRSFLTDWVMGRPA
ncbi:MAG TPA: 7-cyano-7-deazaguanine synthase [Candidatus Polarisedimenticolia bacterium]|nr:7-cyano-7-deazaguanine synthase [Candidatus Polarisedimenticolia bacterium]